jgi:hypothetical protein
VYFTDGIIDELLRVQKLLDGATEPLRVTEHEKVIMEYIKKHGSINESEYARITSRARSTRILDFKRLVARNAMTKFGRGKATFYRLSNGE